MTFVLLAVAVVAEVAGTLCMRVSRGFERRVWLAPFVVLYAVSFGCLGLILHRGMPVGVIYAIWSASGVTLAAVASKLLFGDVLSRRMAAGIAVIVAGVVLVELGSRG